MIIKKIILFICAILSLFQPISTHCYSRAARGAIFGITFTSICIAAIYGLTRKFCKPKKFKPTKKNLNIHIFEPARSITRECKRHKACTFDQLVTTIHRGKKLKETELIITDQYKQNQKMVKIHRDFDTLERYDTIFIASRGYAKGNVPMLDDYLELTRDAGAVIEGHMLIKDNLIHDAPCITFDYPDDPLYFNFGQNLDVSCFKVVWNYVLKKKPNPAIVGIGDCRGGKVLLSFATTRPAHLKALVLMSPFVSDMDLIEQIAKNHIKWLPWSNHVLLNFFKFYFPTFNAHQDTLLQNIHKIDPALPIFIGYRKNDFLVSEESLKKLIHGLRKTGNKDIYVLIVSDDNATHSRISPILELQYATNAFLAAYELPHNQQLAQKGQALLEKAKIVAQSYYELSHDQQLTQKGQASFKKTKTTRSTRIYS